MTIKIDDQITGFSVVSAEEQAIEAEAKKSAEVIQMHEKLERPENLQGVTYKIKTPLSEHALYVTINDVILNPGTDHELRRPFEIFINSKNMDHFQWIVALTRIISAVFRKGGDVTFLVEELHSVFDPKGGYFKPGGVYTPSLVADIGDAIESHLKMIGMIREETLSQVQQEILSEKRAEFESRQQSDDGGESVSTYPAGSSLCGKCSTKAVILLDGCMTCLSCGDSKCG